MNACEVRAFCNKDTQSRILDNEVYLHIQDCIQKHIRNPIKSKRDGIDISIRLDEYHVVDVVSAIHYLDVYDGFRVVWYNSTTHYHIAICW